MGTVIKHITGIAFVFLLVINTGCSNEQQVAENETQIISMIISNYREGYLRGPLKLSDTTTNEYLKQKVNNLNILIDDSMSPSIKKVRKQRVDSSHHELVDIFNEFKNESRFHLEKLSIDNVTLIKHTPSYETNELNYEGEFDMFLQFSRIAFDESCSNAIVSVMSYFNPYNAGTDLYILRKKDGTWTILDIVSLGIV